MGNLNLWGLAELDTHITPRSLRCKGSEQYTQPASTRTLTIITNATLHTYGGTPSKRNIACAITSTVASRATSATHGSAAIRGNTVARAGAPPAQPPQPAAAAAVPSQPCPSGPSITTAATRPLPPNQRPTPGSICTSGANTAATERAATCHLQHCTGCCAHARANQQLKQEPNPCAWHPLTPAPGAKEGCAQAEGQDSQGRQLR